jgi:hypothetical protein
MPVRFEGPDGVEELVPAPLISIQKTPIRGTNGVIDHFDYVFTLNGTIVNVGTSKDSPDALADGLEGILGEQIRIRRLFSNDGGRLEIEAPSGGGPNTLDAYCTIDSISFAQGVWYNRSDYTIVLRARVIEDEGDEASELESFGETWNFSENEDGTYTISHQIQAKGALVYTSEGANDPLEAAKTWVQDRTITISEDGLLINTNPLVAFDLSELISSPSSTANYWNKSLVETMDRENASFNVTENLIYYPGGSAKEDWTASVNLESDNPRRVTISISGSVFGHAGNLKDHVTRRTHAETYWNSQVIPNLTTRLTPYIPVGYTLNLVPITKQISRESIGIVRYTYTYYATLGGTVIPNAVDESITINDTGKLDVFAQIQVPGRANGPVFQPMRTYGPPERSISITAKIASSGIEALTTSTLMDAYLAKPDTTSIIEALKPSLGFYYVRQDSEEWNPFTKQYSRSVAWVLQPEAQTIDGIPRAPRNWYPL